jgi:hypothetical protein
MYKQYKLAVLLVPAIFAKYYANQAETPVIKFPKETMSFLYHSVRLRYAIVTHIFISQTEQYYLRYFQITMPAELSTYHKFSKRL